MTSQIVGQIRNRYLLQLKKHFTIKQIIHQKYGYATEANSNKTIPKEENKTFRQKARDTWNGPNFKYWVIGATGFFGWMGYYGMKNYKNKCLDIEIFPPMPNHVLVNRNIELNELYEKHKNQTSLLDRNNMKKLLVLGVPGTGKTVLVKEFIELLKSKQNNNYLLPKSNINIFLQADTESSFLISLKAFAAKLKVTQSDLNEKLQTSEDFHLLAFNEQCNILLECIQESLAKHPGWVITIDSIQQITSSNIYELIKYWFLENQTSWSSGTLILVNEGVNDSFFNVDKQTRYQMKKG